MPNFVTCKCEVSGSQDELNSFVNAGYFKRDDHTDYEYMDFDMIVPQPKTEAECDPRFVMRTEEDRRRAMVMESADKPWFNWYGWNVKYWGTKWTGETVVRPTVECMSSEGGKIGFIIQTAWSFPEPIAARLGKEYPELVFKWLFADEDLGHNCGVFTIRGDDVDYQDRELDLEFACMVKDIDYEEYLRERNGDGDDEEDGNDA